ncbi:MAG: 50S ribosomal protein L13 [Deltaproteobacteria bacterium RIFCSPHIGHO2_02_FULL_40_11]|nr:MAG: 50S ribosomal protein L13 [Deltaproteobacteria bacterium RIFCSPHIGHO2_02_FULL_40_11]
MSQLKQKTYVLKPADHKQIWYIVDAKDKTLGRLSTKIATVLRGKNKPIFTPHVDCGDLVIVTNAEKVRLTGNKWDQKMYYRHSHHVGGLKTTAAKDVRAKHPERLIHHAVRGMLPKNSLGRQLLKKLKVYAGETHPHKAQNPQPLKLEGATTQESTARGQK